MASPVKVMAVACKAQYLTNFYRSIELLRFDTRDGSIYLFAGEELQITIYRDGTWEFLR